MKKDDQQSAYELFGFSFLGFKIGAKLNSASGNLT